MHCNREFEHMDHRMLQFKWNSKMKCTHELELENFWRTRALDISVCIRLNLRDVYDIEMNHSGGISTNDTFVLNSKAFVWRNQLLKWSIQRAHTPPCHAIHYTPQYAH